MKKTTVPNRWLLASIGLSVLLLFTLLISGVFPMLFKVPLLYTAWFVQPQPHVFFSTTFSEEEMQRILSDWEESQERVQSILGERNASPLLLFLSEKEPLEGWGLRANKPAASHYLPGFSLIVVGPSGKETDIIAHELMHAELHQTLGWWIHRTEIPLWFDEGFALLADYRYHDQENLWQFLTENGSKAPTLRKLSDEAVFHQLSDISPLLSYYTSFRTVRQWWEEVGMQGWERLANALKEGKSFEEAFHRSFQ